MKEVEISAKNVDLAVEEALSQLQATKENVVIEVISTGGLFSKAKVRVTLKETEAQKAQGFVNKLLALMKLDAATEIDERAEETTLNIVGSEVPQVIGHRGEVIDALQYITSLVLGRDNPDYKRVLLDSEGYRSRKQARLEDIAVNMAQKAVRLGNRIKLEAMTSYERRIVHAALTDNDEVTTQSEGDEPYRYIVITPKKLKSFTSREGFVPRDNRFRPYNNTRSDNRAGAPGAGGDRPDRPDRPDRADRPDRSDRPARTDRANAPNNHGYGERRPADSGFSGDRPYRPAAPVRKPDSGFSAGSLIRKNPYEDK
ncbi:MAG: KH domain-containing protein [Clostridiales bacterium]|jgi:spoIIIJ-associated protein|nr:KH domain-containing protein [Clostridiales bacterium]